MTSTASPAVSVVINTRNEEQRLPFALRSVRAWATEVVVVDMESEDRTCEVARDAGAIVIAHPATGFVEPARAAGVAAARGEWILVLDADELVPEPLSRMLLATAVAGEADAVRVGRRNYLLGAEVRRTGWNPDRDRHLRFFRAGHAVLPGGLHEPIRARPGSRVLDLPVGDDTTIVHFNYVDVADFLDRLNRYTSIEAGQRVAEAPVPGWRAVREAAREWAVRYLWHRGWRDGWRGLYLSLFMAMYRLAVRAKQAERAECGPREQVARRYREEAERLLAEYGRERRS